jgi:hypothetical protein
MRITLLILFFTNLLWSQSAKVDSLFVEFKKDCFYGNVYYSKFNLESMQEKIIPTLIKTLRDTSFVKLTCTADLIYPGADHFDGHGYYVPYNLDWISVRAGWLLEDLTFQDFGYKTIGVDDDYLLNIMKTNYEEYIQKGTYDIEWKNKTPKEKMNKARLLQAKAVEKWWKENKKTWNRLSAVKEALLSDNVNRISEVIEFLRYGETKCTGLNQIVFKEEIKPLAILLSNSNNKDIKETAALMKDENLNYWLSKMIELEKK